MKSFMIDAHEIRQVICRWLHLGVLLTKSESVRNLHTSRAKPSPLPPLRQYPAKDDSAP